MSDAVWSRLAAPFGGDAVAWVPVEVAEAGDEVRVVALVVAEALRARLDGTVGIAGWGVAYAPLEAGAMTCHVTVAGVTKGAVAPAALAGGPVATAEVAFARAAELFGLRAPLPSGATAWVPCDPETLVPLHPPEFEVDAGAAPVGTPAARAGDEAALAARNPAVGVGEAAAAPATSGVGVGGAAAVASAGVAAPVAAKPTGQQMIDRLVDRLKEEGQGLAAARLLVRYGGYGKDPDTARELYAQLRVLLRGEAVAGTAGGGPA